MAVGEDMFYPFLLDSRVLLETLRLCEELDTTEQLHLHFSHSCIGEGNGNSLQCSCLENPRDGVAWRAAVYGVTQSRTRLTRLSSSSSSSSTDKPICRAAVETDIENKLVDMGGRRKETTG